MKKSSIFALIASIFMLASCGGGGEEEKEPVSIDDVIINPTSIEMDVGDASKKVNYNVFGKGEFSKEVEVSSANEAVATAKLNEGERSFSVTAVAEGETTITLKSKADETKAASLAVKINPKKEIFETPEVYEVKASSNGMELALGTAPQEVTVTVTGKGDYDKGVDLVVTNDEVISINKTELQSGESFTISALATGNSIVQITSKGDKTKGAQVPVLVSGGGVIIEDSIALNCIAKEVDIGDLFEIVATATNDVTFSVEGEEGVISFTQDGNVALVEALSSGEVTLVASLNGSDLKAPCVITVKQPRYYSNIQMVINGGEPINMDVITPSPEGLVAQYIYQFASVSKGVRIDFKGTKSSGSELITSNIKPNGDDITGKKENNLKPATESGIDWTVQKDATNCKIYFEIKENEVGDIEYGFWLEGGPEILVGYWLEVNGVPFISLDQTEDEGEYQQYAALGVELEVDDIVKIYNADSKSSFCPTLEVGGASTKFDDSTKGQLKVVTAGKFDFYVKLKFEADLIYIGDHVPATVGYGITVDGGDLITLDKVEVTPEGMDAQYTHTFATISKDTRIDFYKLLDDETTSLISSNISPNADGDVQNNLKAATVGEADWTVLKDGENVKLYFEIKEGAKSFWLEGGPEPTGPVYEVKVGATAYELELDDDEKPGSAIHQYSSDATLVEGATLEFYIDKVLITSIGVDRDGSDPVPGNNAIESDGSIICHNDFTPEEGHKSVYLKQYDGGYSVWASGYQTLAPKLMGIEGDFTNGEKMSRIGETSEYVYTLAVATTDAFKVKYEGNWFGYEDVKSGCISLVDQDKDGNIVFKAAGLYDIKYDLTPDTDGNHIWISSAVSFSENPVSVEVESSKTITVTSGLTGFEYAVKSGDDSKISLSDTSDSSFVVNGLAEGSATILVTVSEVTLELAVNVTHKHIFDGTTHYCECGELDPDYVSVTFKINYGTQEGQDLYLVHASFNAATWESGDSQWDLMTWTEGNNWVKTYVIEKGTTMIFKFVCAQSGNDVWEGGSNRNWTFNQSYAEYIMYWQN